MCKHIDNMVEMNYKLTHSRVGEAVRIGRNVFGSGCETFEQIPRI